MRKKPMLRSLVLLLLVSSLLLFQRVGEVYDGGTDIEMKQSAKVSKLEYNPKTLTDSREEELFFKKPDMTPVQTLIKVYKKKRILELYGDDRLIGRFKIALGGSPEGDKIKEGDSKTPIGKYYICTRNDKSRFVQFMGVSYPNTEDAVRGLESGLIDRRTFENIKEAEQNKTTPPWNTPLGGEVGIHGGGTEYDWTLGCMAVSNEDVNIIWEYAPVKTPVEIYE